MNPALASALPQAPAASSTSPAPRAPVARRPPGLVAQLRIDSPVGPLHAAASDRGVAWLSFDDPGWTDLPQDPAQPLLAALWRQLARYWTEPATPFDVALDLHGTPFQRRVWDALTRIPSGATRSYADIAAAVGSPSAVRAVGAANRVNPVAIVVPCHRVIGRDGTLTGYAGGLPRKAALLAHEAPQRPLLADAVNATSTAAD